ARLLGNRLREVAPSALVAIAHRLLAAADRVLELVPREPRLGEQGFERERPGRLAGEVLEENRCGQALVLVMSARHRAEEGGTVVDRQAGVRAVEPEELERVGPGHASVELSLWDQRPEGPVGPRLDRVPPPPPRAAPR